MKLFIKKVLFLLIVTVSTDLYAENGSVSGVVYGEEKPLVGANVFLEGTTMGATSDSFGNYLITGIPVGKYIVRADFLGYTTQKQELYISITDVETSEDETSSFSEKLGLEEEGLFSSVKGNTITNFDFFLESSAVDLDEVVVSASRKKEKVTDAPSVVSLVNEQTIRRRVGVSDFNRLASLAKGVDVTYFGIQGAQINARGFDGAYSTRFRQFCDGLYLGEAVSGMVYSLLSGPPKESISRIEVLFGPQSALYGPDASQGLLNIITKHPRDNDMSEVNLSMSNLNDPRVGARFAKNYDKFSIDISGETKFASELPYGNDSLDIFWVIEDTLYLNEDLYDPIEMRKNQVRTHLYYKINNDSEFSAFNNYIKGEGYAMGSLGPVYNKDLIHNQSGLSFTNDNHFFRITSVSQTGLAAFRANIGIFQVTQRNDDGTSLSWKDALEQYSSSTTSWWTKFNSDDIIIDYQYTNQITNDLNVVAGYNYEFKDPDTDRTTISDEGVSPITGEYGGKDINEYRYGFYGQIDYLINTKYNINTSIRYDDHEFYGSTISPRASLVRKNFLNGNLKLIAGKGFKAPTLMERNIYAGQKSIAAGSVPYDWVMHGVTMGSPEGFTIVDFKDLDGDELYSENDSLLNRQYIEPIQLEEHQSLELAYTGVINKANLFEVNFYSGKYKNFKGPLTVFAVSGPGWNPVVQAYPYPIDFDGIRQINYGDKLTDTETVPLFTYALTYPTLMLDVSFFGFDLGWKHVQSRYEIAFNFSYFNDDNLTEKRKKGRKYLNLLNSNESSIPADSIYKSYYEYANIYSNTPNFKGSLSATYYNSIIKNLTTTVTIKGTSPYDFESGWFAATKDGKGEMSQIGQSWWINPGRIGGDIYSDIDMIYQFNNGIHLGFSIKNVFETQAPTYPLSPKIPRYFLFETGFSFK